MANIDIKPSKTMANLLHILPAYTDDSRESVNMIVEINAGSLNKYEIITETGHLKLDRVGYSPMTYPFVYGAIPGTWDLDGDPLDILIPNVTEPLVPGSLAEARIIGVMKFVDGGEQDDKIIAVLSADKRFDHIKTYEDLGEYFVKESTYYWEHYKDMKKPGTGKVEGFFGVDEARKILDECIERYATEYAPKLAA
ncbi:MAG TPA: inorganic diphosphatase [bacterium]|nr:inorganic diphosphatase [bacterium]